VLDSPIVQEIDYLFSEACHAAGIAVVTNYGGVRPAAELEVRHSWILNVMHLVSSVLKSMLSSSLAACVGLIVVLLVGMVWWTAGSGPHGILLGCVGGGLAAKSIQRNTSLPASSIAACLGAGVATYFAIVSAEVVPPGEH